MALKHQVFHGSAWSLAGMAAQQVVNVILFVMLVRLLPVDFGVIAAPAMVAVLVAAQPVFLQFSDVAPLRAIATALVGALLFGMVLWFAFPSWRRNMQMELKSLLLGKGSSQS
jgi:ABC-type Na+ efflux pump permease subunit